MSVDVDRLKAALADRYAIERELGRGGMATVYLAADLKHDRQVALKVLKPELAAVLGAERFLSEIRTTAHLQHPNILPLFDSGEAAGQLFYVMPYVEGESLRERLDREKQLPVVEAVRIASEVAEALGAAHDEGVIHRDIKPANILLRKGRPLVADFGIALAVSAAGEGRLTETGLSLGTPYYMSPEQAAADREPTAATDVYSLGCVLYEMLTGEPPFAGGTAQAVLARILTGDAARPTEFRKAIPLNIECAILKAIEKLPADRFASMREFARALADPAFRWGPAGAATATSPGRWKAWAIGASALSLVLLAALAWVLLTPPPPTAVSRQRVELFDMGPLQVGAVRFGVALSPNGSTIALVDTSGVLRLKRTTDLDATPIAGATGARSPVFSPDGRWIAYFADQSLYKIPVTGGTPLKLADSVAASGQEAAWLNDGSIIFNRLGWRLARVSQDGGPVETLTTGTGYVDGVSALAGARAVLFDTCDDAACLNPAVHVYDLETDSQRIVLPGARGARYLSGGYIVYADANGAVLAAPFDPGRLETDGAGVPVIAGVATRGGAVDLKVGPDGTLLYLEGPTIGGGGRYQLVWVTRSGEVQAVPGFEGAFASLALSPDDRSVAIEIAGAETDIWVKDLPDGALTRISEGGLRNRRPEWSYDGQTVFWQVRDLSDSISQYFVQRRADGSVGIAPFARLDRDVLEMSGSADGNTMVARVGATITTRLAANTLSPEIWAVRLNGDSTPQRILAGRGFDIVSPSISPDGHWLAYASNESGQREVYVRPFPDVGAARHTISVGGGVEPLWSPRGDEIFFRRPGEAGTVFSARVRTSPAFGVLSRDSLFSVPGLRANPDHRGYDVSSDGQRFLFPLPQSQSTGSPDRPTGSLVLVRNWLTAIREAVRK